MTSLKSKPVIPEDRHHVILEFLYRESMDKSCNTALLLFFSAINGSPIKDLGDDSVYL